MNWSTTLANSSDEKLPSRRDFLRANIPSGAHEAEADQPQSPLAMASYLLQLSRRAMACQFEIYLAAKGPGSETEAGVAALDLVNQLEAQLSAYRPDSELCRLNATAWIRPIPVETKFFELLQLSQQLFHDTGGAFDITSGQLTKAWGFYERSGRVPEPHELTAARRLVGGQHMSLDSALRTVFFAREGLELNLGSIGKGYALDRCRELMQEQGVADFLIHGGTSSVLAAGRRQDGSGADGWLVGVPHPNRPNQRIGTVVLKNEALGTSGAAFQAFFQGGKRYGHVLDPRSGYPATQVSSATVLAPTATLADALATAIYVMGPHETERFLEDYPGVSALLLVEGKRRGRLETIRLGDQAERFELSAG